MQPSQVLWVWLGRRLNAPEITVHTNTPLEINLQPITAKCSTKGQDSECGTGELLKLLELPWYKAQKQRTLTFVIPSIHWTWEAFPPSQLCSPQDSCNTHLDCSGRKSQPVYPILAAQPAWQKVIGNMKQNYTSLDSVHLRAPQNTQLTCSSLKCFCYWVTPSIPEQFFCLPCPSSSRGPGDLRGVFQHGTFPLQVVSVHCWLLLLLLIQGTLLPCKAAPLCPRAPDNSWADKGVSLSAWQLRIQLLFNPPCSGKLLPPKHYHFYPFPMQHACFSQRRATVNFDTSNRAAMLCHEHKWITAS